jgi:hypothetical protein
MFFHERCVATDSTVNFGPLRVRDLEGAFMPVGTPNNRRIHDCDGSNGQR